MLSIAFSPSTNRSVYKVKPARQITGLRKKKNIHAAAGESYESVNLRLFFFFFFFVLAVIACVSARVLVVFAR